MGSSTEQHGSPALELPIERTAFAVVDVETTGLGHEDRVVEVACVRLQGLEETARFQSLVHPGMPIAPAASAVSGITDEIVQSAPIFPEIAGALEPLMAGSVFVAHNAPFDLRFLSHERKRWQLPPWEGPVLDTLRLARNTLALPSYALSDLTQSLHLASAPAHRALADALATAALLAHLIAHMSPRPESLGDLLRAQEPVPASWEECLQREAWASFMPTLAAAAARHQVVVMEYQGRSSASACWVRPIVAEHNGPLYYLRAVMIETEEERVFRVDRILSARIAGETGSREPTDTQKEQTR